DGQHHDEGEPPDDEVNGDEGTDLHAGCVPFPAPKGKPSTCRGQDVGGFHVPTTSRISSLPGLSGQSISPHHKVDHPDKPGGDDGTEIRPRASVTPIRPGARTR